NRRTRTRRDDQAAGPRGLDLIQRDLIVADDPHVQARVDLAEALDQVVRERIVVINQEDHASLVLSPWSLVEGAQPLPPVSGLGSAPGFAHVGRASDRPTQDQGPRTED